MKKTLVGLLISGVLCSFVFVNKATAQAYTSRNVYLNAGVSFLFDPYRPSTFGYWSNYNYSFTPPVTASLEVGISDLFSVGGYASHRSYGWDYTTAAGKYKYTNRRMSFGGRFSFHYLALANEILGIGMDEEKLDFYVTGIVGVNVHTRSDIEPDFRKTDTDLRPFFGPILGFRYMFNNNFGAYLESGRGSLGYANIGLTLKL
ncbi:MAG: hypothetical protein WED10_10740 [Brumimicrobium sp.]